MRAAGLVVMTILSALFAPMAAAGPTVRSVSDPALMRLFEEVIARGGYGGLQTERTAFIVQGADGSLHCQLWPYSNEYHRQSWSGVMPSGTVAIAHTHPNCCRDASPGDRETARSLGLPFFILTSRSVVIINPDGTSGGSVAQRWKSPVAEACSVTR